MLDYEEALKKMLEPIKRTGAEKVGLLEASGRILAEDVIADSNVPFSDNSAMDGYAVLASDTAGATEEKPVRLDVIEEIPAGKVPEKDVARGTAARIFTGAVMPAGADAVVMQEFTEKKDGAVLIRKAVKNNENVRLSGEDIKKGQKIFSPGRRIGPADVGVIASAGYREIGVSRKPVAGVVSTGSEVVEPDSPAGPGVVRNSNSYAFCSRCAETGVESRYFGIVPDIREEIEKKLEAAAGESDLIITSGGVSVGDYDLVTEVLRDRGEIDFWKIRMKPGKPVAYGRLGNTPFLGLPGNPVSVMVGFELFARPILMKMMDAERLTRRRMVARMEHEHREKPSRMKILRGIATYSGSGITVRTTGMQGSGILMSVVLANCFIVVPEGVGVVEKGAEVEIIPLDFEPSA